MTIDKQNTARFKPTVQFYKVEIGSRTVIELESYPLNEYGTIEGKPITISDSSYHDSLIAGQIGLNKPVMINPNMFTPDFVTWHNCLIIIGTFCP